MADPALAIWMFPVLFGLVLLGIPVGFALIVTAAAFGWPFFADLLPRQMYGRLVELAGGFAFAAVPAFIFMGAVLERAGIAERLFEAMRIWLGRLPGGLSVAAIAMAAVFAATTGIIGAVEIVIGMMAMPAMLKAGYDKRSGGGHDHGGRVARHHHPAFADGGDLRADRPGAGDGSVRRHHPARAADGGAVRGLYPGLCGAGAGLRAARAARPSAASRETAVTARALVPAVLLIGAVLGRDPRRRRFPTEAAATGSLGAPDPGGGGTALLLRAGVEALTRTATVTAMLLTIVFGGTLFSSVFTLQGGGDVVASWVGAGAMEPLLLVALLLAIVFVLGFLLDWTTIVLLAVPVFTPLVARAWRGSAVVRRADAGNDPDFLPHAALRPGDLLPAVHRPAGDDLPRHRARPDPVRDLPASRSPPWCALPWLATLLPEALRRF